MAAALSTMLSAGAMASSSAPVANDLTAGTKAVPFKFVPAEYDAYVGGTLDVSNEGGVMRQSAFEALEKAAGGAKGALTGAKNEFEVQTAYNVNAKGKAILLAAAFSTLDAEAIKANAGLVKKLTDFDARRTGILGKVAELEEFAKHNAEPTGALAQKLAAQLAELKVVAAGDEAGKVKYLEANKDTELQKTISEESKARLSHYSKLKVEHADLDGKHKASVASATSIQAAHDKLKTALDDLQDKYDVLEAERDSLKIYEQKFKDLSKNATTNSSSAPLGGGKKLPHVGPTGSAAAAAANDASSSVDEFGEF